MEGKYPAKPKSLLDTLRSEYEMIEMHFAFRNDDHFAAIGEMIVSRIAICKARAHESKSWAVLYTDYQTLYKRFGKINRAISKTSVGARKYAVLVVILITAFFSFTSCDQYTQYNLQQSGNNYWRTYTWIFHSHTYQMTFSIPVSTYNYYASPSITLPFQFNSFATEDPNFPYLAAIDEGLYGLVKNDHLNDYELCQYVLCFVQSIQYSRHAQILFDCPKSPAVTLMRGFKDCKDGSVIFSALISTMGITSRLIFLPGHIAVGVGGLAGTSPFFVSEGTAYAFAESTDPSVPLSEVPDGILPEQIQWTLPVKQTAFFDHRAYDRSHTQYEKPKTEFRPQASILNLKQKRQAQKHRVWRYHIRQSS